MKPLGFLVVACLFGLNSHALAQAVRGNLVGRVLSEEGEALGDVSVSLSGPSLQGERFGGTDARGYFRVIGLPVGTYAVRFQHMGYRTLVVEEVSVRLGRTVTLGELRLAVQPVELEPIVVTAGRLLLDPTASSIGQEIEATSFETLPTGRDYASIIELLPYANTSYYGDEANVGGTTGLENVWYIDGVNVTDPYQATTGTGLPHNFVKAIDVEEAGYQAEHGRGLGAIVNVVTQSGSNELEASAFGYFTNSGLSGDARFGLLDATVEDFTDYDLGLSVGGPVLRDRLWYFAAYNPSVTRQHVVIPGHGPFLDKTASHRFAGKLTWRAAENADVELSVFGDPTKQQAVNLFLGTGSPSALANPDPALWNRELGGVNFSLRAHGELGSRFVWEGLLARHQRDDAFQGTTEIGRTQPLFKDQTTGVWEGGLGESQDFNSVRASAQLSGTLFLKSHTLKAGAEYEGAFTDGYWRTPAALGEITESDSGFQTLTFDVRGRVRSRVPTLYLQDSWRVRERLRLNAGLRWESQYFIGVGDTVNQAITGMLQPRLGAVVRLGEAGTQKVFGSWGRFYQQLPNRMAVENYLAADQCLDSYSVDPRGPGAVPDASQCWTLLEPRVDNLKGEHFDQVTLGYEQRVGQSTRLAVRGIRRDLRAFVGWAWDSDFNVVGPGNLGEGDLSFMPRPKRNYTALELTAERAGTERLNFMASYVLSRSYGNYSGLYVSDAGYAAPGNYLSLQLEEQAPNSTGLLPNDRTHVLKLSGSYRFDLGLTAGAFFTWQSGTPRSVLGASSLVYHPVFLVQRGSAGRTPSIWDLNFRFTYDIDRRLRTPVGGRLILDLLHVASRREAVWFDQQQFLARDDQGNQLDPNPSFGHVLRYQPPFMVRLGFEVHH